MLMNAGHMWLCVCKINNVARAYMHRDLRSATSRSKWPEVAVQRNTFAALLSLIAALRSPPTAVPTKANLSTRRVINYQTFIGSGVAARAEDCPSCSRLSVQLQASLAPVLHAPNENSLCEHKSVEAAAGSGTWERRGLAALTVFRCDPAVTSRIIACRNGLSR
jgi:hypothetical protein